MRSRPFRRLPLSVYVLVLPLSSVLAQGGSVTEPLTRTPISAISTSTRVMQVVPALGGKRYYYVSQPDTLWMFDVASKRSTMMTTGEMTGLTISAKGDLLAFARLPDGDRERNIWTLPIDARTGLATGMARRASASKGRSPAISPDSKWIAFAADSLRRTLAVIPSSGGSERDVVVAAGSIGAVQWSGDGSWIYYSSQLPAPAAVPAGSSPFDARTLRHEALYRVAASGGTPDSLTVIPRFPSGTPWSISADDRLLSYLRFSNPTASLADQAEGGDLLGMFVTVIADTRGAMLTVAPLASFDRALWISKSQLLAWFTDQPNSLKSLSLATGSVRELIANADVQSVPVWHPRGTHFAAAVTRGNASALVISSADGTTRREVSIPSLTWQAGDIAWSPNGEWIAIGPQNSTRIIAVHVASGRVQPLSTTGSILGTKPAFRWTADSRHVRYLSGSRPQAGGLRTIRETGLDGRDTLVREIAHGIDGTRNNAFFLAFLTDTSVVFSDSVAAYTASLRGGQPVPVYKDTWTWIGASFDGRLLAIRPNAPQNAAHVRIDVVNSSGVPTTSLVFPYGIGGQVLAKPVFTPDGKRLIVSGRTESGSCCSIYDASVTGGAVKKLADFTNGGARTPWLALSPDGTTLLFTTSSTWLTNLFAIDVSGVTRNATGKP